MEQIYSDYQRECEPSDTSPPTGLSTIAVSSSQINLSWTAPTDDVGITGYRIYRNGAMIGTSTSTSYNDTGLSPLTQYCYTVSAFDAASNESNQSSQVCSTTTSTTFDTYTNSIGMTFNLIPAGTFTMGSPEDELGRDGNETQHQVTISNAYYMQTTEVTQAQWEAVMGSNPSYFSGCADCPVEQVSWNDVQDFVTALNAMGEGTYRLPTEAEWEYAARAGSNTALANGDITETLCEYDPNLDAMGWYCYNSDDETHPVARKDSNAWGLYDMHGNVWEFCQDWYQSDLGSSPVVDPTGPSSGSVRVLRGGGWYCGAKDCRSAGIRSGDSPGDRERYEGFRLARTP